jgi:hypothetical protein
MTEVRPVLRYLHSPDVPDLAMFVPQDEAFGILVQAMIGPHERSGEESFDIMVCNLQWLAERVECENIVLGTHHLIMREYNYAKLHAFISKYVSTCSGATWAEVAIKLGHFGWWEFEGYKKL